MMIYVDELPNRPHVIQLSVQRRAGINGAVSARWRLTGEHNGLYDISPLQGIVCSDIGWSDLVLLIVLIIGIIPMLLMMQLTYKGS